MCVGRSGREGGGGGLLVNVSGKNLCGVDNLARYQKPLSLLTVYTRSRTLASRPPPPLSGIWKGGISPT